MMDFISDGGLIHDVPVTGYYWVDVAFYVAGSGVVGFAAGTVYCSVYRKAHRHEPQH